MNCIYFDHNATTPVDPRVKQALLPYLEDDFGNASSANHAYGWKAKLAVENARKQVGELLGTGAERVIWTSGATESNNLAILGLLDFLREQGEKPHFITEAIEHKAVLQVMEAAQKRGAELTVLPVVADGRISLDELKHCVRPNTRLISIMAASNEIGTLQPIKDIAAFCAARNIIFHCDAAQAVGRVPLNLSEIPIDLLSLSGHKIYGPKGVGALINRPINRDFELRPALYGGTQENGIRPGTFNVPGIVGLGAACEILRTEMIEEAGKLRAWQKKVLGALEGRPGVKLNGAREERLCNNLSLTFVNKTADEISAALKNFAFSSGSACSTGNPKPSYVLRAIGCSDDIAKSTVRLGFGRFNTESEINQLIETLLTLV